MSYSRSVLAVFAFLLLAACKPDDACRLMLCEDGTRLQLDYAQHREQCRQLAELKAGLIPGANNEIDENAKTKLVTLFSECMTQNGWTIPGPEEGKKTAAADSTPKWPLGTEPIATPVDASPEDRQKRAAECAFARQEASHSLAAKRRAEACDQECANQQKVAPEAPKSVACP